MAYIPGTGSLDDDLKHAQVRRQEIENDLMGRINLRRITDVGGSLGGYGAGAGIGYAGGGPVYKNSNPTAIAFGKSGDSKLLAKSRGAKG